MKKRRVRNTLIKYVVILLDEKNIPYTIEKEGAEFSSLLTKLSSREYHRLIERAMCLNEQENVHNGRLTISYWEWSKGMYDTAFHMLSKDKNRFMRTVLG